MSAIGVPKRSWPDSYSQWVRPQPFVRPTCSIMSTTFLYSG